MGVDGAAGAPAAREAADVFAAERPASNPGHRSKADEDNDRDRGRQREIPFTGSHRYALRSAESGGHAGEAGPAPDALTPRFEVRGIGISLPGRFNETTQRVVFAPNLRWPEFELAAPLEQATGLRVEMENAANACLLAEVWFGHAERLRDVVVVTVSEGVGAGLSMNGHLVRGVTGMVGEFGHVSLDADGPPCGCGSRGCWEVYASNRAALRYYHESQKDSSGMAFGDLLALADAGDALALKALDQMAQGIARGLPMIVRGLAPEEIVFVGEFTRQWSRFAPVIEDAVAKATLVGRPPHVFPAADPGVARLRGSVALVLQKHFGPLPEAAAESRAPAAKRALGRIG